MHHPTFERSLPCLAAGAASSQQTAARCLRPAGQGRSRALLRTLSQALVLSLGLAAGSAHAAWPEQPLRIVAPFAPASTPDTVARVLAEGMGERLGQTVIVENRQGAGGMIGTDAVARAKPDGYTLGVSVVGPLANNKLLYKQMPYDPDTAFSYITVAVNQPSILVARNDLPIKDVAELIQALKAKPDQFNYASIGNGSLSHLTMELIAQESGSKMVHVPYAGSSQAVLALMAGEVDVAALPAAAVLPQVQAGKLRALAVTTGERSSLLPELPTLKEGGLDGVEAGAWIALVGPAGLPGEVIEKLHEAAVQTLADPKVAKTLGQQYMEVVGNTPAEFQDYVQEELARWTPVIRDNRISLD
ncbi:tripartite tricarboxylate transporter substrate binding protein [Verticiella sediminum]|uniref:Tripartite tricarboxylate transporter substrate binding protein n=1 Tax=Verticiella sediminum TaxID=1247510 RepID=A0A556AJ11_9BURK|nr:tripartite tricarboxylate transporter substrate binding protein [Verticiella sediminum]TSH92856.1 tripartite tricarboxylate transporter substrate binding protein [Verticiella sediminum]